VCIASIPVLLSVDGDIQSTLASHESSIDNSDSSTLSATNLPRTSTSTNDLQESCCFRESRKIVAGHGKTSNCILKGFHEKNHELQPFNLEMAVQTMSRSLCIVQL
ncbi:unnamed protein product, partial [Owenia fusiformis]